MSKVKIFASVEEKRREAADAPRTDAQAFHAVVDSRRSVRVYADDPIPAEVMDACLDAALKSPNSSNLQAWEMHHVVSPDKKQGVFGWCTPFKWILTRWRGTFKPYPREPIGKWGMRIWAHKSTALACAHFMLAMRAHGFDTCPMEGLDSARVKRILGLPKEALVTMVISAGKRAEGGVYGPRLRFNREHFVHTH